mgnify:CR=1 FL=1
MRIFQNPHVFINNTVRLLLLLAKKQSISRKCSKIVLFYVVIFGYSGINPYHCIGFYNMLIINAYFDFCDM